MKKHIIPRAMNNLINIIPPLRSLRNSMNRAHINYVMKRAEMYAAAKTTRLTGAWSPTNANINDIIGASAPYLRARQRQLIRDFPYLARAVRILVDYTIGNGIMFQSVVENSSGKHDKKIITKIEDAIKWWMEEADASGKQHYYEMMRLEKRQDVEAGEFVIVKTFEKVPGKYIPYQLQAYEADWLTSSHDHYNTGGVSISADPLATEIRQGIEYYKLTGRVKGYWFCDPNYGNKNVYVAAENVVHGFEMLRPQQLRGVPAFAPGILIANDLDSLMNSEIDATKMASKWMAIVKTKTPEFRQQGLPTATAANGTDIQKIEELENAIIEYLRPDEEMEFAAANRPGTTFEPFVRLLLTMLSITTGAPYELISGDYRGLNLSTAQICRSDFAQQLRPIAARHIRQFAMPTINTAIDIAVLTGKITLPGYWQNPRRYYAAEYQPPGMDAINPLREAKAQIEAISSGLQSPQEVARKRGRDLEDIYKEILDARNLAKEMGLTFEAANKPEKNNPAAVEEQ